MIETIQMTTPSDREIGWTRKLNATRDMVFDTLTKPELLQRWLLGPDGWSMPVCEVDLRVGGKFRYVWEHKERGDRMGMHGIYKEIINPAKLVHTEVFDEPWYPGEALATTVLTEQGDQTILTTRMLYATREARDGVLKSNMEKGLAFSYKNLADLLASLQTGAMK